ncbi:MAG: aminotransferase class V-fold PLP-dependent enzyme [Candidatus Cryptobacteroides sp.]
MTIDEIRKEFPALSTKVYGKDLVYFDNAATSQRPRSVIDKWNDISVNCNANIHRAVHYLSSRATDAYEEARDCIRDFINASSREEIVFTSGATASVNLVAYSFGKAFISPGDEIVVAQDGHHSNIVPWQLMCRHKGAVLRVVPVDDNGNLELDALQRLLNVHTKLVAVSHISNVLGIVHPVRKIVDICHSKGIPVLVDGAQGVVHCKVDVRKLGCDFYVFSGHKMYAAPGTGVLYGKKKWLDLLPPFMSGGEMVGTVSFSGTTFAPVPLKFEAGTQNFAGISTFVPAVGTVLSMRTPECLDRERKIKEYIYNGLLGDNRIRLFGTPASMEDKIPLFSFVVEGAHHEDLALILDKMGIAVRSGQMCAEPLMDRFGVTGMLRVSLAPYNTMEEAEYFMESLDRAVKMVM